MGISKVPQDIFSTSSSFLTALAKLHCDHFRHQRNDVLSSELDGEEKYTRRQAFYKLVQERSSIHSQGFKFWCDGLRPSNVLVNAELDVVSVIDWEFSYSAPAAFATAPPWWLLLIEPEKHELGVNKWAEEYEARLPTFLTALREQEAAEVARGSLRLDQILSDAMEESWATGDFWIVYAARKGFAFDDVYAKVAPHVSAAHSQLSEDQIQEMKQLVAKKVTESHSRELVWEPDEIMKGEKTHHQEAHVERGKTVMPSMLHS